MFSGSAAERRLCVSVADFRAAADCTAAGGPQHPRRPPPGQAATAPTLPGTPTHPPITSFSLNQTLHLWSRVQLFGSERG